MGLGGQSLRLAAIVFTDIVGYSAVINRDAVLGAKLLDRQRRVVRKCLQLYGGREVETAGDSFLLEFPSALKALECVADIQRRLAIANAPFPDSERVRIRASIHLGDVEHRRREVFGDGVNVAARLLPLSPESGVAFSETVQQQVRNRVPVRAVSIGSPPLKNIEHPLEVFTLDAESIAQIQPTTIPKPDTSTSTTAKSRIVWIPVAGLIGCLITAAAMLWLQHKNVLAANRRAIAVLPFANFSGDGTNDYLAEGIHESLLTNLASIGSLKVISRTSVGYYKDKKVPLPQIGRELGVGAIVEGSVQRAGERMLVHVQLIDAANDEHLWARSYDRPLADIFAVENELAAQVAAAVNVSLSPDIRQAVGKAQTSNPEAYRLYIEARRIVKGYSTGLQDRRDAERMLKEALTLDPDFALAYVALADAYIADYANNEGRSEDKLDDAQEALVRAAKLAPDSPDVHIAWGDYYYGSRLNLDAAQSEFEAVLRAQPNNADAHESLGRVLRRKGNIDEAIVHLQRAAELDPQNWDAITNLATTYCVARNYAGAVALADHMVELEPTDYGVRIGREWMRLDLTGDLEPFNRVIRETPPDYAAKNLERVEGAATMLAMLAGRFDEAIAHYEKMPDLSEVAYGADPRPHESLLARLYWHKGDRKRALKLYRVAAQRLQGFLKQKDSPSTNELQRASLAEAFAALGRSDEARRLLDGLKSSAAYQDHFRRHFLADVMVQAYLTLGDRDAALESVRHVLLEPSLASPHMAKLLPALSPLHGDPRFEQIVAQSQKVADTAAQAWEQSRP